MLLLRVFLLSGLVAHKLVWEALKVRGGASPAKVSPRPSLPRRAIKLAKALALAFLVLQTAFLDVLPISDEPTPLRIAGTMLYVLGLALAVSARVELGRNWANIEDYRVLPGQRLVKSGIYAYVRHPIYAGDVLLLVGLELALNSWLVLAAIVPLVVVVKQAAAEEALLSRTFDDYEEYRQQTKRYIPFVV